MASSYRCLNSFPPFQRSSTRKKRWIETSNNNKANLSTSQLTSFTSIDILVWWCGNVCCVLCCAVQLIEECKSIKSNVSLFFVVLICLFFVHYTQSSLGQNANQCGASSEFIAVIKIRRSRQQQQQAQMKWTNFHIANLSSCAISVFFWFFFLLIYSNLNWTIAVQL